MPLESAPFINSLNPAYPSSNDPMKQGDDHLRLIKSSLKNTFPNIEGEVTATHSDLNGLTDLAKQEPDAVDITGGTITGLDAPLDLSSGGTGVTTLKELIALSTPTGVVQAYAGSVPPTHWLECNGQEVDRVAYAELYAAIGTTYGVGDGATTFNVPDLRGEFIRGWDNSRGVDISRVLGSFQGDEIKSHRHKVDPPSTHTNTTGAHDHSIRPTTSGSTGGGSGSDWAAGEGSGLDTSTDGAHKHSVNIPEFDSGSTGGVETRPRNVAMMYIIKT